MPSVIINLKEIFATDNQVDISTKVNFNFNQLLALGIGQPGPIGLTGSIGPAGPIGPTGLTGPVGSVIYSSSSDTGTPSVTPPSGMLNNDILITSDTIWKKTVDPLTSVITWIKAADFNQLVITALGVNISPYLLLAPGSRIVKPRITTGTDLTTTSTDTDPNYATPGLGKNYQTVLYNFDEQNTSSLKLNGSGTITISSNGSAAITFNSATANPATDEITVLSTSALTDGDYVIYSNNGGTTIGGLNNYSPYYILITGLTTLQLCATPGDVVAVNPVHLTSAGIGSHKLITVPAEVDSMFPNTANLTLYSFFNGTADPAKEFATTARGYRHQLEIGSIDNIPTVYPDGSGGTISASSYLISPSFENLRVRKYRVANSSWGTSNPGAYYLRAEYDMSSAGSEVDEQFSPRRNSEHIWKINKAETTANAGRTVEMRFTNSNIFTASDSGAGFALDGVIFKKNASISDANTYYVGLGFHESTSSKAKFAASSNITTLQFDGVSIELKNGSSTGTISINSSTGVIEVIANGVDVTTTADIRIKSSGGLVKIGNSSVSVPVSPIVINNDRLGAGLPFPSTQVSSSDVNTLDDYEEGGYINALIINRYDRQGSPGTYYNSHQPYGCHNITDFLNSQFFTYTKIGRRVNFNAAYNLDLNYWPYDDLGNGPGIFKYTGLGLLLPFPLNPNSFLNAQVTVTDQQSMPSPEPSLTFPGGDESTWTNHIGSLMATSSNGTVSLSLGYIYLYAPNALPVLYDDSPAAQFNKFSLFDRDARNPSDSSLGYSSDVTIRISGSYDANS